MHRNRYILPIPGTCIWRQCGRCGRCGVLWHRVLGSGAYCPGH